MPFKLGYLVYLYLKSLLIWLDLNQLYYSYCSICFFVPFFVLKLYCMISFLSTICLWGIPLLYFISFWLNGLPYTALLYQNLVLNNSSQFRYSVRTLQHYISTSYNIIFPFPYTVQFARHQKFSFHPSLIVLFLTLV